MSAVRLHSHSLGTPTAVGQELNRCLAVVRVATSRRGDNKAKTPASRLIARSIVVQVRRAVDDLGARAARRSTG